MKDRKDVEHRKEEEERRQHQPGHDALLPAVALRYLARRGGPPSPDQQKSEASRGERGEKDEIAGRYLDLLRDFVHNGHIAPDLVGELGQLLFRIYRVARLVSVEDSPEGRRGVVVPDRAFGYVREGFAVEAYRAQRRKYRVLAHVIALDDRDVAGVPLAGSPFGPVAGLDQLLLVLVPEHELQKALHCLHVSGEPVHHKALNRGQRPGNLPVASFRQRGDSVVDTHALVDRGIPEAVEYHGGPAVGEFGRYMAFGTVFVGQRQSLLLQLLHPVHVI